MKFRKLPVEIEAVQFTKTNNEELEKFIGDAGYFYEGTLSIATLEGTMNASANDWIIKGIGGEFYPCKPDIFEATYEEVL